MRDVKPQRNMVAILRVLRDAPGPMGSERIARELRLSGIDLSERTVRNYLFEADAHGWTTNLGRRGRRLTGLGRREADGALVMDKVGFVAARVDELTYQMTFDPYEKRGRVIVNVSTFRQRDIRAAARAMLAAYESNLGMGRLLAIAGPGERIGDFEVPGGLMAVGTICSVSINGVFLREHISTTSKFGGLLELESGQPKRFVQIVNYDGSTLDPLEIFIRGYMTRVTDAAASGSGVVGASFREVPAIALAQVRRLASLSEQIGLGGVLAVGRPNMPLLEIPVAQGRVGLILCGGLNPMAAVVESGIATTNAAMKTLCEFDRLVEYTALRELASGGR